MKLWEHVTKTTLLIALVLTIAVPLILHETTPFWLLHYQLVLQISLIVSLWLIALCLVAVVKLLEEHR